MSKKAIKIVYTTNDVAYIGYIDPVDMESSTTCIKIEKPFALNIRPVEKEGTLEGVVLDVLLPIEFGGLAVGEGLYSGFVNFMTGNIDLPNGKTHYMSVPNGEKLAVNRVASIANRDDPFILVYNVSKIIDPSIEIEMIYNAKILSYNEVLFSPRAVDLQPSERNSMSDEPSIDDQDNPLECKGNIIDLGSKMKH